MQALAGGKTGERMDQAANKADVVDFSEAALSGYARVDVPDIDEYDFSSLEPVAP